MNKHIVIVLNTSWNVYNFRLNLLKSLQKDGYNITVISPYDKYSSKLEDEGFNYIDLKMNNDGTNIFQELRLILTLFQIYKRVNPDIILQYTIKPNIYGTLAATLLNIPVINNISGLGTIFLKDRVVYRLARLLYRIILRFPKKIFFQNRDDYEQFIEQKLVKSDNSEVIPGSGIDIDRFAPIEYKDKDNTIFYFLMIARLIKDKGLIEYIEAARVIKKRYSNVKFQLIGSLYLGNPSAITENQLNSWIDEGIIEYLGVTDHIETIISKVDCVVLPSYREGLSRVLLEAASMEKPIITTNVPGCKDVVEERVNGFLCNVKDSNDLARAMVAMLNLSLEKRIYMGKQSRIKIINGFHENILISIYKRTIENIIKK